MGVTHIEQRRFPRLDPFVRLSKLRLALGYTSDAGSVVAAPTAEFAQRDTATSAEMVQSPH
jgi:hypothetical protein